MYSNKVAVLSGDYLLARASVLLARLQHKQVVEVMAKALDSLVSGEIMQIKSNGAADKKAAAAWAKVTERAKAIRDKGTEATGKTHTVIAMQPMLHAMLAGTTGKKKAHKRKR